MKQFATGLLLMIVGVLMFLDLINALPLGDWFVYLWAALVFLIGFEILLSAQRHAAEKKIQKRVDKEKSRLQKELEGKHNTDKENLQKELEKKNAVVEEQEGVIDDMVNPKK